MGDGQHRTRVLFWRWLGVKNIHTAKKYRVHSVHFESPLLPCWKNSSSLLFTRPTKLWMKLYGRQVNEEGFRSWNVQPRMEVNHQDGVPISVRLNRGNDGTSWSKDRFHIPSMMQITIILYRQLIVKSLVWTVLLMVLFCFLATLVNNLWKCLKYRLKLHLGRHGGASG